MVKDLDAGPVYLKEQVSLEGAAEETYIRVSTTAADMISRIIFDETTPSPQVGEATVFKRRTPPESELPAVQDLDALYDFIRMLGADTYPRAYLDHAGLRF